ncbi:MAG: efflux RND transporter periplasmic adaptor subunit, partial [Geminicoccaceae bacterium]
MASVTYENAHRDAEPARPKPSRRRVVVWFVIVALLLGLVGGGLFAFDRFRAKAIADFFASQVPPPTPVAAEPARLGPMPRYLDGIGTLTAVREVEVSPEVAGRVEAITFEAGAAVAEGAPLVQLNDAPEKADLAVYQAAEKLALANLARTQQLVRRDFATQATMDENQQALEAARAGIARSQAVIDQKVIKAPFAGELGLRGVELGQFVSPGDKLVTLTDLTHLYATFTLPERDRSSIAVGQPVE